MKLNREILDKPSTWLALAGVAVLAGLVTWGWRWHAGRREAGRLAEGRVIERPAPVATKPVVASPVSPPVAKAVAVDAAADKAARVKKILRDYDDIQAKMSADYAAAGRSFPGGLNTFLQQIALLEREKRADLAKVMTARELEDYEIRETAAGQKMRAALDGTAATDEQRRAVFRAEQEFDDQFGFTYDVTPKALAVREAARQATQDKVFTALGVDLFAAWLQRTDPVYAHFVELARQQNLPDKTALSLLGVRNGFTLSALDIAAAPPESAEARRTALLEWGRAGVAAAAPSLPPEAVEREVASWLPRSQTTATPVRP